MTVAIEIQNLSKIYRLGEIGTGTISRDLERWYKMKIRGQEDPFLKIGETNERNKKGLNDIVYSLKDINLKVQQGEALGIIGKNGAGKSTLLKILSRVTSPTTGKIHIKGRIASLLEVGTGFHPELTGRENIYLNGAIMGMRKKETSLKLDEIIDFSGVERYIDTPVKRYSSGMYVRLAFAVAAHLESEIMIVDEVLAVGDAEFQKKCLGKMGEVSKGEGRTVLFVSHQMAAIQRLCECVLVLKDGKNVFQHNTRSAIDFYLKELELELTTTDLSTFKRSGSGLVKLTSFAIENVNGFPISAASSGEPLLFAFGYKCKDNFKYKNVSIGFSIHNAAGDTLVVLYSNYAGITFDLDSEGIIKCQINNFPFSTGRYYVGVRVVVNEIESDWPKGFVGVINVEAGDFYGKGNFANNDIGPFLLRGEWIVS